MCAMSTAAEQQLKTGSAVSFTLFLSPKQRCESSRSQCIFVTWTHAWVEHTIYVRTGKKSIDIACLPSRNLLGRWTSSKEGCTVLENVDIVSEQPGRAHLSGGWQSKGRDRNLTSSCPCRQLMMLLRGHTQQANDTHSQAKELPHLNSYETKTEVIHHDVGAQFACICDILTGIFFTLLVGSSVCWGHIQILSPLPRVIVLF